MIDPFPAGFFFRGAIEQRGEANSPGVKDPDGSPDGHVIPSICIPNLVLGGVVNRPLAFTIGVPKIEMM